MIRITLISFSNRSFSSAAVSETLELAMEYVARMQSLTAHILFEIKNATGKENILHNS